MPGFEDLAGEDGMHTRCIGFLDLKLSRSFIERHMLPEALDVVNSLKADLLVLKQTTNSLHFFFWDYIFLEGEETNRTRSSEFSSLYYTMAKDLTRYRIKFDRRIPLFGFML